MGGRVGDALAIVQWLVDHGVHATIFMTGSAADSSAGRQVLAIIDAHPSLLRVGNHTYTHTDIRDLDASQIRDEVRRTETAIAATCDQSARPFFRPPYGGYDAAALATLGAAGYRFTVLWDVDTIDWRPVKNDPPGPTTDQIVTKVLGQAQGGSIVLNHLGGYNTLEALPRVVDGLRDAGFTLVRIDELLT
jgi:peptidoglycan-N-acetylglucosamine deacetylase